MRRGSHPSPRTSTSEWVPMTATSSGVMPVVAASDPHQHQQVEEQFPRPGESTVPLLSDEGNDSGRLPTLRGAGNSAASAYPYAAGSSTSYEPSSISRLLRSAPIRNTFLLFFVLVILSSLLHVSQPELVDHGYRVLSNAVYRNMGWKEKEEMVSLDSRLRELLERPALDQWEFETLCRHGCPFYTYSRNTYFYHDGKDKDWENIKRDDIRRYRNAMISHLKDVEASGDHLVWTPDYLKERGGKVKRGIILTGGEGSTLKRMQIQLDMLRNVLGCTLPIELYHFPDEMQDPETRRFFVDNFDVQLKEFDGKRPDGKSWHIKNAAFITSDFTEFIYMDSDNIPLIDPATHFDSVEYKESGSVFWPDLYKDHPDNAIWRVLGKPCSDEHWPAETGQVVFDKRGNNGLNLAVLHLANHMITNPDMYGMLGYGDKDLFRYSFYALSLPYQQAPKIFATTGGFQTQNGEDSDEFCGHSMIQWGTTPWDKRHDPSFRPQPAFLHTILAKHRRNLQPDKLFSHLMRPRIDNISEPTLVRTPYHFSGDCFKLERKGPDGLPDSENSMRDGQGVLTEEVESVMGGTANPVYVALKELAQTFVDINKEH
ncbi:hypothetical protein NCC49_002972 [Naganishia albida]|nr:hypothetical protein NCC49_002972 [Naganishia albida]